MSIPSIISKKDFIIFTLISFFSFAFVITVSSNHTFEPGYNIDMDAYCYDYKDKLEISEATCKHREFLGGGAGDSIHYFAIALGKSEASYPPYTLRPFLPKTVGALAKITTLNQQDLSNYNDILFKRISLLMRFVNMFCIFLLILIPAIHFKNLLLSNSTLATLFLSMNVVNFGVLMTAPFFMLDIATYVVFTLGASFYLNKKNLHLLITICLGMLVKEIVILLLIPLFFNLYKDNSKSILYKILILVLPVIVFFLIRIIMIGDALFIQIGWNLSDGKVGTKYFDLYFKKEGMMLTFIVRVLSSIGLNILLCSLLRIKYKLILMNTKEMVIMLSGFQRIFIIILEKLTAY